MRSIIKQMGEPLHVWTNSAMIIEDDSQKEALVFQAGVNELIASAAAVIEGKKSIQIFRLAVWWPMSQSTPTLAHLLIWWHPSKPMNGAIFTATSTYEARSQPICKNIGRKRHHDWDHARGTNALLKAGTVNYIGFSLHMSGTISTLDEVAGTQTEDIPGAKIVSNPYISASDWG